MLRASLALAALLAAGCAPRDRPFPRGEVVDLSHAYDARAIFWPTSEPFRLEKVADGVTEGGYYYAANNFFAAEHGGTHLDAPLHFAAGRQAVDQVPIERLLGDAIVVDVTAASERDPDYQVGVDDFERWEAEHGRIPADAIVLLRTGFSFCAPGSPAGGPMRRDISARPREALQRWRTCTFPGCMPMPPDG
jgi:hypothetical protein